LSIILIGSTFLSIGGKTMTGTKEDSPVVVASFINPIEAHLFKGLLESEGIESFIYHEHSTMNTPVMIGGIRVAVRVRDEVRARVLLKEAERALGESE